VDETENPTVSLSEKESRMLQRLMRSSRRDVERVDIEEHGLVTIKMFALNEAQVPYEKALAMSDDDWVRFFIDHPPLI